MATTATERLHLIESAVSTIAELIEGARTNVRGQIGEFARHLSNSDWNQADELAERMGVVEGRLRESGRALEELRVAAFQLQASIDSMAKLVRLGPIERRPSPGEAVNELVRNYLAQGASLIQVEEVLGDLSRSGYKLDVQNPAAVVSSILARHPRLKRKSGERGAFLATTETDPGEDRE